MSPIGFPHSALLKTSSGFWRRKASEEVRSERLEARGMARSLIATILLLTSHLSLLTAQTSPPLTAQEPAGFADLRDSIAAMSDTSVIRDRLDESRQQHKQERENLSAALRSGLLALRLGELRADPDYSEALSIFRAATKRAPQQPEPWYGLGLAEEGRSAWEMSVSLNLGNRVGLKALERAARNHRNALQAADDYTPAAVSLAQLALDLRDTTLMERSLP